MVVMSVGKHDKLYVVVEEPGFNFIAILRGTRINEDISVRAPDYVTIGIIAIYEVYIS